MNKFELLKQLMSQSGNPEKDPDYMKDQYQLPLDQRIQDIKGMTRNPELYKSLPVTEYEEPASNNIWYAPDELVAGAIAPGVQRGLQVAGPRAFKTLQAMGKATPTLANEAGVISLEGAGTRVGKELDVKEGESIVDAARKSLIKDVDDSRLAGRGIADMSGSTDDDAYKALLNWAEKLGQHIKVGTPEVKGAAATHNVGKNLITLDKSLVDPYDKMGILSHELQHADDINIGRKVLEKWNPGEPVPSIGRVEVSQFPQNKLELLNKLDPNLTQGIKQDQNSIKLARALAAQADYYARMGDTKKAVELMNAIKYNHHASNPNFELQKGLEPLFKTAKELTPEEQELAKLLNMFPDSPKPESVNPFHEEFKHLFDPAKKISASKSLKPKTLDDLAKIAVEKSLAEEAATDSAGRSSPYLRASATKAMRRFADERRRLGLTDQEQINIYTKYYRELLDKLKKDKE